MGIRNKKLPILLIMFTSIGFFQSEQEAPVIPAFLNFILVSTNTTTGGDKAFIKYDSDGNEITSKTYTEVGGSNAWRPRFIYSESDDSSFYYTCGDISTSTINKWNTDLTNSASVGSVSLTPRILPIGNSISNIITTNIDGVGFRTKAALVVTGTSRLWSTTTSGAKTPVLMTATSEAPASLLFLCERDGSGYTRKLTTNASVNAFATGSDWTSSAVFGNAGVYNSSTNELFLQKNGGSMIYVPNASSSGSNTSLSNVVGSTCRCIRLFSNGDLLWWNGTDLIRRTRQNVIDNTTTNVWNITLASVVWFDIDDKDNVYIVFGTTTNGLRKYNSGGNLIWQVNLPAAGYGGGLAHK